MTLINELYLPGASTYCELQTRESLLLEARSYLEAYLDKKAWDCVPMPTLEVPVRRTRTDTETSTSASANAFLHRGAQRKLSLSQATPSSVRLVKTAHEVNAYATLHIFSFYVHILHVKTAQVAAYET